MIMMMMMKEPHIRPTVTAVLRSVDLPTGYVDNIPEEDDSGVQLEATGRYEAAVVIRNEEERGGQAQSTGVRSSTTAGARPEIFVGAGPSVGSHVLEPEKEKEDDNNVYPLDYVWDSDREEERAAKESICTRCSR